MQRLSSIVLLLGLTVNLFGQNPHGSNFKMDCAACHTSEGWEISAGFWKNATPSSPIFSSTTGLELPNQKKRFNHNNTEFILEGQHTQVNCKACHQSLVFSEALTTCVSCHTDMHEQTLGMDCARCHNSENWLVDDITQIHYDNGFPLVGSHAITSCNDCHISASDLRFNRIGNECTSCHLDEYTATTNPNHASAGFSTNCVECHNINGFDWSTENINHDFFPLSKGHEIADCASCHTTGDYNNTPTDCYACHQEDYAAAINPNHSNQNFPTDCIECHTTDLGWTPAEYRQHDVAYFPIYSGEHNGEWDQCLECHTNPSNYAEFACTTCHESGETGNEHQGVGGYSYNSTACLACHPTGNADDNFNHNLTNFALTGEHTTSECIECHSAGFAGTPTACIACHTPEFNQTTNPNHNELGISTDCAACHTTDPEWNPAAFANHNEYYMLNGAHATVANDCAACHNGDYINTPNTCQGCHIDEYNATTDPNHVAQQFSTECLVCHSEDAWEPANFDHNQTNFALLGAHTTADCLSCHESGYAGTPTDCASCHIEDFNSTTDPNHVAQQFSTDCKICHSESAWDPAALDHNLTNFPLTGEHINTECAQCHTSGYAGTPTACIDCHTDDFNQTTHPNHNTLGLSADCAACHTTEPEWNPATFANHNDYYALNGAHASIANECATCHNGDYINTPNTCAGCHLDEYNATTDPNHVAQQFSTECMVCHSENAWEPATFDHNETNFILNGAHTTTDCISCHTSGYAGTPTECASCHIDDFNSTTDPNHIAQQFSTDCKICHSENAWDPATLDHNQTNFPLTGEHINTECAQCHTSGYAGTSTACTDCHTDDFNQTTNPNHNSLGLSNDCAACHSTEPEWNPATFANHNDYYALNGAHAAIANDCATCHNGDYINTPNTCVGCHLSDYNTTTNPDHSSAQFPTDCESCHTENAWEPSTFDHDGQYFPIYSGKHREAWNQCMDCHSVPGNFSVFACIECHEHSNQADLNDKHSGEQDYTYTSIGCFTCHPTGNAD